MLQQQVYVINTVLMVIDAVCVIIAGYLAYHIKLYYTGGAWMITPNIFIGSVLFVMFLNNYLMGKFRLYSDARPASIISLLWSIFKALSVVFAFLFAGAFLYKELDHSREFLLYFCIFSFILISVNRVLSHMYFIYLSKKGFNTRQILVVGDIQRGKHVADMLQSQLSYGHTIVGHVTTHREDNCSADAIGCLDDFHELLRKQAIDEVVFALKGDRNVDLAKHLAVCKKMGVPARILPALWQYGDQSLSMEFCQDVPFLTLRAGNFNATGLLYKRVLDLVGGLIGTIIMFILYPIVGAAIKLDSPGPVLFKQKRMGRHGRIFNLYKFRSMYEDAEDRKKEFMEMNEMNGALFKLKNDPRITRVGRFLRKTSLDEFPQFLNVLKGEMSLVGTRPPTLDEVEEYQPEHLKRISAKPGITGLWQVSGRNQITDFEEVVKLDCYYLDHWRFFNDLKILVKTIYVVFRRKGAV
jgi:exopolysaccharide biosynthesis polyprenyl glycosylphosphotransferase